jgi:hypothetical protein
MKSILISALLMLVSMSAWCDFSCPDGAKPACLDNGDKVCPAAGRCVDNEAICFDQFPCDAGEGFVCESKYNTMMMGFRDAAKEHDALVAENVGLRQQRLEEKNCVLNASTLARARKCVF